MYDFISGRLVEQGPGEVTIDAGGIGYRILVPGTTAGRIESSKDVKLYVEYKIRKEQPCLYGFSSQAERVLFRKLVGVNRIGPSIALALLSTIEPATLVANIESGDSARLAQIKGVGKRTAERLCVELKGQLIGLTDIPGVIADQRAAVAAALAALGYPRGTADSAASTACNTMASDTPLEDLVKEALRHATPSGAGASL